MVNLVGRLSSFIFRMLFFSFQPVGLERFPRPTHVLPPAQPGFSFRTAFDPPTQHSQLESYRSTDLLAILLARLFHLLEHLEHLLQALVHLLLVLGLVQDGDMGFSQRSSILVGKTIIVALDSSLERSQKLMMNVLYRRRRPLSDVHQHPTFSHRFRFPDEHVPSTRRSANMIQVLIEFVDPMRRDGVEESDVGRKEVSRWGEVL